MATVNDLITDCRSRVVEPTARFFTDTEFITWLDWGQKDIANYCECIEAVKTDETVAYKREYNFPDDYIKVETIQFQDDHKLKKVDGRVYQYLISGESETTSDPVYYTPWANKYKIHPRRADSAYTTTLGADITASTTMTMTVADATNFPVSGRVRVGTEVISYDNTTTSAFLYLTRAEEGTTATTHSSADTVTARDLTHYYYKKPVTLTATAQVTELPSEFDELMVLYATAIALKKDNKYKEGGAIYEEYVERRRQMGEDIEEMRQSDSVTTIKDESKLLETDQGMA